MEKCLLQIVVIIVIWVISLLVIYMLFLICLDPLLNKRIHKASANIGYHEHNNEDVSTSSISLVSESCMDMWNKCLTIKYIDIRVLFFFYYKGRLISPWNVSSNGGKRQRFESRWTPARQVEATGSGTEAEYLRSSYYAELNCPFCSLNM